MGKNSHVILSKDVLGRLERVEREIMARIDFAIIELEREREQIQLSDEEYGDYVRGRLKSMNRWPSRSIREYYQMKAELAQIEEEFSEPIDSDDPEVKWKWFYEKNIRINQAI